MGALQSIGTAAVQRTLFNTGYITFGSVQPIDISDIGITMSYDAKEMKALNSIKIRALKRANFKVEANFTIESHSSAILGLFCSASSAVSGGTNYTVKDGQANATTFYITGYIDDDVTKAVQYQFTNPIITIGNPTKGTEAFETKTVTVVATDVEIFEATAAAN